MAAINVRQPSLLDAVCASFRTAVALSSPPDASAGNAAGAAHQQAATGVPLAGSAQNSSGSRHMRSAVSPVRPRPHGSSSGSTHRPLRHWLPSGQHLWLQIVSVALQHRSFSRHFQSCIQMIRPHGEPPGGTHTLPTQVQGAPQHLPPHTGAPSGQQLKPSKQR